MKISILTLTYNRIDTSQECIYHMLNTIDEETELLIWDNGSNDGTFDWLYELARSYDNVRIYGSEENFGIEAINYIAEKARGKYLLKVDDDIFVPYNFANRLLEAYEIVNEPKLAFLAWNMAWKDSTFATRSGMKLYRHKMGRVVKTKQNERVLIHYTPRYWLVNGACRFGPKDIFFDIGGHPKGIKYGVDFRVSKAAEKKGYYIGFFDAKDMIEHKHTVDSTKMRAMKDAELRRIGAPKHL